MLNTLATCGTSALVWATSLAGCQTTEEAERPAAAEASGLLPTGALERDDEVVAPWRRASDGRFEASYGGLRARVNGRGRATVQSDAAGARASGQAPIEIETSALRRGAEGTITRGWAVAIEGGDVVIEGRSVVERLRVTPRGLSQSWTFAERPAGGGDLEVRVSVTGRALGAVTGAGVQLTGGQGTRLFRYSHAIWVDASGRHTEVPARVEDGQIALRVPESVVTGSTYPAVLDPWIGPEAEVAAVTWKHRGARRGSALFSGLSRRIGRGRLKPV